MGDLLVRAVRVTATAAEADVLLRRVAALLVDVADWVLADRLDEPDLVTRVAVLTSSGPVDLPPELGPPAARRSSAGSIGILPTVLASAGHVLRLDEAALRAVVAEGDPHAVRQAAMALERGATDVVLIALVARGTPLGVLTLGSHRRLPDDVVAQLPDVARHVATALDAARLLTLQNAVASTMQQSLLPPLPAVPGLSLAARYAPAARGLDVGGDWYDAFRTTTDVVVAIGDVTGHDLAAAARMADLRNLLRAHAVDGLLSPGDLLSRLAQTASVLGLHSTATVTVGRLSREDGAWLLRWSNAGHPPPVLLSQGRARLLEEEPDLMLGVDETRPRATHAVALRPGDLLVLYTDGLVEQRGTSLDERLEGLRRAVEENGDAMPDPLAEHLLRTFAAASADDVALLVLRADG
ncbi:MAG: DNA-binding protein [Frankiales bacterium]|nr:DNA-binding protein [Frankiales bacterium]